MIFALALVLSQVDAGEVAEPPPEADAPVAEAAPAATPSPVEPVESAPPMTTAEAQAGSHGFVKGELSVYLGSDRLSVKRNRVGVSLGVDFLESTYYALIEPQIDLRFFDAKLGIGIGVPLRVEVLNFNDQGDSVIGFAHAGRLRTEDYDSVHDFGRVLKYVNFGKKEDNFYVNIGQRYATSIGHGAIMRRYAPNIDVDYPRASAEVDAYNDYAGFEAFTNDILEWNVLSAIAFVKPFSFFHPENLFMKTLSVGVTGAMDRNAPDQLIFDENGARALTTDHRLAATQGMVGLVGVDAEVKVIKTDAVDIKPYVDYSMMIGGDGGLTVGALGRFNLGRDTISAFRVVVEGKYLGNHYAPEYFDTFYEIDRYQAMRLDRNAYGIFNYATKRQMVLGQGLGTRAGFYLEASWGIPNTIGLTLAFEGATGPTTASRPNFIAHLEIPWLNFLQVFASFYKRGIGNVADFGKLDENTVVFAGLRLRTLPFLFINGRVFKTFRVNPDLQAYTDQVGFSLDLELGFEFGESRAEAEEIAKAALPPQVTEPTPATDGVPPTPSADPNAAPAPESTTPAPTPQ